MPIRRTMRMSASCGPTRHSCRTQHGYASWDFVVACHKKLIAASLICSQAHKAQWHYFCAIIDILQPFNIKKKAESVIFQSNEEEISAVPSDYYGQRILDFVEGHCA